jgi:hypothetical protein
MNLTNDEFNLTGGVKAHEYDKDVFAQVWQRRIPRQRL